MRKRSGILWSVLFLVPTFLQGVSNAGEIPIESNGSLGSLTVPSGAITFNTNGLDLVNGGSYTINGIRQPGTARLVSLPQDSGGIAHPAALVFVYDFATINLGPGSTVSVVGNLPLILLALGDATIAGLVDLSGPAGVPGNVDSGGGGGAGGGSFSVFADGDVLISGTIRLNGGGGAASYQAGGDPEGGSGGRGIAGGGNGGQGGLPNAGGKGANGGDGAQVGIDVPGANGKIQLLTGGGGGGGGAYNGGKGGPGALSGKGGDQGGLGHCTQARTGGKGGDAGGASTTAGDLTGKGGTAGGGDGNPGSLESGGGGGGGGNAPDGTSGGFGGPGGVGGSGGGGGGGGGDVCSAHGPLDNGGGGGGGGGGGKDGNPGSVIPPPKPKKGGGGGGGKNSSGSKNGKVRLSGHIESFGGSAPIGGDGSVELVAPTALDLVIDSSATFNGNPITPNGPGTSFTTALTLSDFVPCGGGGGGGAGGSGINAFDTDGDGAPDILDCRPFDPTAFAIPGEITSDSAGNWQSLASTAGVGTVYDTIRGEIGPFPGLNVSLAICYANDGPTPGGGGVGPNSPAFGYYYLVRGQNACGTGSYGRASTGAEEINSACP